ncbi:pre-mRNA-splicing factor CWC25 homolog [Vigna unguiculata]|uniref:Pre-mRNA splicing factor n=1 Tax=Vigna unguiculata TaxID=3917 RepID=A0A4D6KNU5_VIGUN|nr:pre-mRNA-splicing factor CWC25 homolog [Vigna unguiculata]QCD77297.1 Pre-mRNA splicing factor [Vigna unguiculata]
MALKFLNKKGWHTGSLRNIENVWKAEQKHEAEQKKLEELRKQMQEERERTEFRQLQEKAGLVPHQERLEFLYDSGLSVGKSSNSEGFKALEQLPKSDGTDAPSSSASKEGASVPGALFEEKPQSANDAWRKLHSDPLLMIRQREQEALAKIKNNPVKMAMIKKSIEGSDHKEKAHKKEKRKKHRSSKSKHRKQSDSEDEPTEGRKRKTDNGDIDKKHNKSQSDSGYDSGERENRRKDHYEDKKYRERSPSHQQRQRKGKDYEEGANDRNYGRSKSERSVHDAQSNPGYESDGEKRRRNQYEDRKYRERSPSHQQRQRNDKDYKEDGGDRNYNRSKSERYGSEDKSNIDGPKSGGGRFSETSSNRYSGSSHERGYKRRNVAPKLSEEERAAKLKQMQLAAEVHEEQRWKRIKKAEESDAREVVQNNNAGGKNFLDSTQKSVYGAGEGGSASIAESVRRRTYYSQGRSGGEGNAFRR